MYVHNSASLEIIAWFITELWGVSRSLFHPTYMHVTLKNTIDKKIKSYKNTHLVYQMLTTTHEQFGNFMRVYWWKVFHGCEGEFVADVSARPEAAEGGCFLGDGLDWFAAQEGPLGAVVDVDTALGGWEC